MATRGPDPLESAERAALLGAPRPRRSLPVVTASPVQRDLEEAREIDSAWKPQYAVWELTLACDLACRHCGSRAGRARDNELSTEECLDLVGQMSTLGVREVTLIGGEAYLRDDWLTVVRAIRERGMECTMTTGGRGITPALAARAAEAGLNGASISIDGGETVHDRLRDLRGSHRAALEAMSALRAEGVPVTSNTQINRLSMPDLPEVLETIAGHGAHSWQLQLTVPMGRAADEPDVLLQPYDLLELFPLLGSLAERAEELGVHIWPGNNIGYFGPYESTLRATMPERRMASCGAGRSTLGIEADGRIKGCPSLPTADWTGGNVRDVPLVEIWERSLPLRYTRDRTAEDLWGYCRECYYADSCLAGCTWTSHVIFGRPGNNPYCHHRALERDREGMRERLVRVEEAPGAAFDHGRFALVLEHAPGARARGQGA